MRRTFLAAAEAFAEKLDSAVSGAKALTEKTDFIGALEAAPFQTTRGSTFPLQLLPLCPSPGSSPEEARGRGIKN
jgi:hypothetical protein